MEAILEILALPCEERYPHEINRFATFLKANSRIETQRLFRLLANSQTLAAAKGKVARAAAFSDVRFDLDEEVLWDECPRRVTQAELMPSTLSAFSRVESRY